MKIITYETAEVTGKTQELQPFSTECWIKHIRGLSDSGLSPQETTLWCKTQAFQDLRSTVVWNANAEVIVEWKPLTVNRSLSHLAG